MKYRIIVEFGEEGLLGTVWGIDLGWLAFWAGRLTYRYRLRSLGPFWYNRDPRDRFSFIGIDAFGWSVYLRVGSAHRRDIGRPRDVRLVEEDAMRKGGGQT